jgi:hypothetical protein
MNEYKKKHQVSFLISEKYQDLKKEYQDLKKRVQEFNARYYNLKMWGIDE